MHTPQPTIYGFGRNVHLWHFPWPKHPWPKCPGRNVLGRNVHGRNVLHSMRLTLMSSLSVGCFVRGGKNGMGCYVRGDKNSMGCYVRGDKNSMGCFVRGGKSLRDVLSGVAKNGMGCFVPGCFVRLPSECHTVRICSGTTFCQT